MKCKADRFAEAGGSLRQNLHRGRLERARQQKAVMRLRSRSSVKRCRNRRTTSKPRDSHVAGDFPVIEKASISISVRFDSPADYIPVNIPIRVVREDKWVTLFRERA